MWFYFSFFSVEIFDISPIKELTGETQPWILGELVIQTPA